MIKCDLTLLVNSCEVRFETAPWMRSSAARSEVLKIRIVLMVSWQKCIFCFSLHAPPHPVHAWMLHLQRLLQIALGKMILSHMIKFCKFLNSLFVKSNNQKTLAKLRLLATSNKWKFMIWIFMEMNFKA